jgi:hypothetical protein
LDGASVAEVYRHQTGTGPGTPAAFVRLQGPLSKIIRFVDHGGVIRDRP